MAGLILLDGLGKEKGAPVGYAANYTTLCEDKGTSCAGNSGPMDVSLC